MAVLLVGLLVLPGTVKATDEARSSALAVVVRTGDTLAKIAARYDISVVDLRQWNPSKIGKADIIRTGAVLVVRSPGNKKVEPKRPKPHPERQVVKLVKQGKQEKWEGYYAIRGGDSLHKIAKRLKVSVDDLLRWNHLHPNQAIRAGDQLRYVKPGQRPKAHSNGRPTSGRLVSGIHLGKGRGYRLRFPKNAFGMPTMIRDIRRCADEVAKRFVGTADVLVGDLSRPGGGS